MPIPDAETRATLPLSDFWSTAEHHADECGLEQCGYCKCCVHGKTLRDGCRVDLAPYGMDCPGSGCGCSGKQEI